jgi:hypothetical protein
MANHRTPLAKAKATGQILNHATRFKGRNEPPANGPLGNPPAWMKKKEQIEAWETFEDDLPWLNKSHRALVGIASDIRGRQIAGEEISVQFLNLLRQCLGMMGATPADASKVNVPDEDDEVEDASAKYF